MNRWLLSCLLISASGAAAQTPITLLDAVEHTIALHPDVRLREDDVAAARGDLQEARGRFDTHVTTGYQSQRSEDPQFQQLGLTAQSVFYTSEGDISAFSAGLDKQLRSGLRLQPRIQVERSAQTLVGHAPDGSDARLTMPGQERRVVSFQITQPLLRGRGRDAVTALERAAVIGVDANTAALQHAVAGAVLRTVTSYWSYVATVRRHEVVRAAESRAETMLEETSAAIAADVQPASDLKLVQATLANRRANSIGADQAVLSARYDLLLATGRDPLDIATIGPPADEVPEPPSAVSASGVEALVALGLARRADLAAARQHVSQLQSLTTAARDSTRPDVALTLDAGYVSLENRSATSPFRQLEGFSVNASLLYRFPSANQTARGQLARTEAAARQSRISQADLERTIRASIAVAWSEVLASAARVEQARAASSLYRSAVEDERTKVQLGLSTALDLIVTEDRMVQSLLDEIAAEAAYSSAVARLRFETGTLTADDGGVSHDALTTVPSAAGR